MAEEAICLDCGGLGAKVENYQVKDENGYEYTAWKQVTCDSCLGSGKQR